MGRGAMGRVGDKKSPLSQDWERGLGGEGRGHGGHSLSVVASYDIGLGQIAGATDFNGNASAYSYEPLGRINAIARPGDSLLLPTQQFTYTYASPLNSIMTAQRERSAESEVRLSVMYFDGLGRQLQVRSQGENGQVIVSDAVTFNARQTVRDKFLPYFDDTFDYAPPDGNLPHIIPGRGNRLYYDPMGRVIRTDNPDGTFTSVVHRPLTQLQYDEEDNTPDSEHFDTPKIVSYDGLERIVSVEELLRNGEGAMGRGGEALEVYTTTYAYDPLGNLTQIEDAQANLTTMHYDALKRRFYMDNPDRGATTYEYDDVGNLLQTTDAKGQAIRYSYDAANRPLLEEWQLDDGAWQTALRRKRVVRLSYHYDNDRSPRHPDAENTLGQLTYIEDEAGATYFSYNARGNPIGTIRYFAQEDLDFVSHTDYDAQDRITQMTYPNGQLVTIDYNKQGLLEGIPGFIDNINYNPSGQRDTIQYANGVTTTYQYDSRLRIEQLQSLVTSTSSAQALTEEGTNGQTALQNLSYTFDNSSNIVNITDNRPTRVPENDLTQTYNYDNLYRLTNVTATYGQIDYTYNSIGNMTHKTSTAADARLNLGEMEYGQGNAGPHALTFADGDNYSYDANGNLIAKGDITYTWDHRNQLLSVTDPSSGISTYQYDSSGQRTHQTISANGTTTTTLYIGQYAELRDGELILYIFADDGRVAQMTTPFDPDQLLQGFTARSNDFSRSRLGTTEVVTTSSTQTLWYLSDHLGGTSFMVDANGEITSEVAYYPYGLTRYESNGQEVRYRYTGKELDATGLHYFGARYYDAKTATWLSTDPILDSYMPTGDDDDLVAGGVFNVKNMNLYNYSHNNPVIYKDPDGNFVFLTIAAIGGVITLYDTYQAYQAGGFSGAAKTFARDAAITLATGGAGKLLAKGGKWAYRALTKADDLNKLPMQMHHFATNKSKVYTSRMDEIVGRFGLKLDYNWNKELMPHLGRHPNKYHDFVLQGMTRASQEAGKSTEKFIKGFDEYVKTPIRNNPNLLNKKGWE